MNGPSRLVLVVDTHAIHSARATRLLRADLGGRIAVQLLPPRRQMHRDAGQLLQM